MLLPTRKLSRLAFRVVAELHQCERLCDALCVLRLRQLLVLESEADVARDIEVREQGVALEDRVDVPLVRRHLGNVDIIEDDAAARRALEPGDHPQGRGLPAAGRADHSEELAAGHVQVDAVDGNNVTECLRQLLEVDLSLHQTSTPTMAAASSPVAKRR